MRKVLSKLICATSLVVFLSSVVSAQSGRIKKPKQKKVVGSETLEQKNYSDSRPHKPRQMKIGRTVLQTERSYSLVSSLVTVPVSVRNSEGYLTDLEKAEFKIFENGVEQKTEYFAKNEEPLTIALVLDRRVFYRNKDRFKKLIEDFIGRLKSDEKIVVLSFDRCVRVRSEPTNNPAEVSRKLYKISRLEGASLYDSIDFAASKSLKHIKGRKGIVVLSDGIDRTSWKTPYRKVLLRSEHSATPIYPIYFSPFVRRASMGPVLSQPFPRRTGRSRDDTSSGVRNAARYTNGRLFLDDLASYSGGRVFKFGRDISETLGDILEDLRTQYILGYMRTNLGRLGDRKKVKIRVARPNLKVRAKDVYLVAEDEDIEVYGKRQRKFLFQSKSSGLGCKN